MATDIKLFHKLIPFRVILNNFELCHASYKFSKEQRFTKWIILARCLYLVLGAVYGNMNSSCLAPSDMQNVYHLVQRIYFTTFSKTIPLCSGSAHCKWLGSPLCTSIGVHSDSVHGSL